MFKFDAGDFMIDAVVDFFKDATSANFIADCHTVFVPNPNILFVHKKLAAMAWLDIAEKCPPKGGFSINEILFNGSATLFGVWLSAQYA